jgi:hypothetical protein
MDEKSLEQIQEIVMGERKFLHDIANKLVVAQGMSSFVGKSLSKREDVTEKEVERVEKLSNSVRDMVEMLKARREYLHGLSLDKKAE